MRRVLLTTILTCAVGFCASLDGSPSSVEAQGSDLIVQDTSGVTRAASDVGNEGSVQFQVTDAAGSALDGAEVTLKNAVTGEAFSAVSTNGVVAFENLAPGTWTVASATPGVTFANVTISSMSAIGGGIAAGTAGGLAGLSGTTLAVGGVAVAGAATAGGIVAANSGSSKKLSPST